MMFWIFLIHFFFCLVLVRIHFFKPLKINPLFCGTALLLPVFGPACLLMRALNRRETTGDAEYEALEEPGLDSFFRSIHKGEKDNMDQIVPIEEVLLVNEPRVRRNVMLDVLYAGTAGFVDEIKKAGTNEDTEVVHYAVTALVELRKDYDTKIRDIERRMADDPESLEILDEYILLDEQYLKSGLLDSEHRIRQLRHYRALLEKRSGLAEENLPIMQKLARTDIALSLLAPARETIARMLEKYPESEVPYLSSLELAAADKNPDELAGTLDRIYERHIHISPENRRFVDFWKREELCSS